MASKHIVCVWEMGGNLGPINCLASLTKEFIGRGYRVSVVIRDLKDYHHLLDSLPVSLYQSPAWGPPLDSKLRINCFSDILFWRGYNNIAALKMMVTAWRHLFQLLKPELVVFNGAPTALLSAHHFDFSKIVVGTGYDVLVPGIADRCFVDLKEDSFGESVNDGLLQNINTVFENIKWRELDQFSDIFSVNKTFITNVPELDLFADVRDDALYCPPVINQNALPTVEWPKGRRIRGFAYLNHNIKGLSALLQIALEANVSLAAVVNGASNKQIEEFRTMGMMAHNDLCDMDSTLYSCDFSIVSGGVTLVQSLLQGKPTLVVPIQKDHLMVARLLEEAKLGICVGWRDSKSDLLKKISDVANNEFFTMSAREVRDRYLGRFEIATHILIGNECDRLLGVH